MKLLSALGYIPKSRVDAAEAKTERLLEKQDPELIAELRAEIFQKVALAFAKRRREADGDRRD